MIGMCHGPLQRLTAPKTARTNTVIHFVKNHSMLKRFPVNVSHCVTVCQYFHIPTALQISPLNQFGISASGAAHTIKMTFAHFVFNPCYRLATTCNRTWATPRLQRFLLSPRCRIRALPAAIFRKTPSFCTVFKICFTMGAIQYSHGVLFYCHKPIALLLLSPVP